MLKVKNDLWNEKLEKYQTLNIESVPKAFNSSQEPFNNGGPFAALYLLFFIISTFSSAIFKMESSINLVI